MGIEFVLEAPLNVPDTMPWLSRAKSSSHLAQFGMTFLTVCVVAPLIATENKYYSGSQPGPNFTLTISIFSIGIPVMLLYFPWAYHHHNKFKTLGKFAMQPRANIVFATFSTLAWAICGIAMTTHANNPAHCILDRHLQKQFGDEYAKAWVNQCNLSKAGAAFAWLTCFTWAGGWIFIMILFWNDKQLIQQSIQENKQPKGSDLPEDPFEFRDHGGMQHHSYEQASPSCSVAPPMLQHQHTTCPPLDAPPRRL